MKPRSNNEVILELTGVPIQDQVHSRVDAAVKDPFEVGNAGNPSLGVVSKVVVGPGLHGFERLPGRIRVGPHQPHAKCVGRLIRTPAGQPENNVAPGQEQAVTGSTAQVFDLIADLAPVFFKGQGAGPEKCPSRRFPGRPQSERQSARGLQRALATTRDFHHGPQELFVS